MSEKLMRALGFVVVKHNAKVQQLALTVREAQRSRSASGCFELGGSYGHPPGQLVGHGTRVVSADVPGSAALRG
eukprot:354010-Chlamydomonas_euryale.AAC.11